eukprot:scaffold326996_cov67-Tisochrysis_lutea.AAC.2
MPPPPKPTGKTPADDAIRRVFSAIPASITGAVQGSAAPGANEATQVVIPKVTLSAPPAQLAGNKKHTKAGGGRQPAKKPRGKGGR